LNLNKRKYYEKEKAGTYYSRDTEISRENARLRYRNSNGKFNEKHKLWYKKFRKSVMMPMVANVVVVEKISMNFFLSTTQMAVGIKPDSLLKDIRLLYASPYNK